MLYLLINLDIFIKKDPKTKLHNNKTTQKPKRQIYDS